MGTAFVEGHDAVSIKVGSKCMPPSKQGLAHGSTNPSMRRQLPLGGSAPLPGVQGGTRGARAPAAAAERSPQHHFRSFKHQDVTRNPSGGN